MHTTTASIYLLHSTPFSRTELMMRLYYTTFTYLLIGYGLKFCLGIAMTPFLYMMKVSRPYMHNAALSLTTATSMYTYI